MTIRTIAAAGLGLLIALLAAACGDDSDLLALENRTGGPVTVEITGVPDDRPLATGVARVADVSAGSRYQTDLVEITSDTSALIRVTGPDGEALCEHVATESEPAPTLVVFVDGCTIDTGAG